ncbi:uncharacterized protein LOC135370519 isoform X1 [Ornithodoros turicata]|uniref:uncharacterized protein LOC135370519 isoform X1 n=1 Tax=Ornithodoros turicata TaxID=34597 RepID=UPI003139F234
MLNASFHPCKNFYKYACGGWLAGTSQETSYVDDVFASVTEDAHTLLYDRNIGVLERDPFWNLVTFYRSCYDFAVDTAKQGIVAESQKAVQSLHAKEWLLDDASSLLERVIRLSLGKAIPTVFDIYIRPYREELRPLSQSKYHIAVSLGESVSKMIRPTAEKFSPEVLKPYIISVLEAIGIDMTHAFIKDLIKFEENFQQRSYESRESWDDTPFNYTSLPSFPPHLQWEDWKKAIQREIVGASKIQDELYVYNMNAVTNITKELFIVDAKLRASYVSLLAVTNILRYRFQTSSAQDTCVSLAMKHFPVNTIYLISEQRIVPTLQSTFTIFVKGIQSQVIQEVAKAMWMTRNHFGAMRNMIKALDVLVPETLPPLLSRDVPVMSAEFPENYVRISEYTRALENKYLKFGTHSARALRANVRIDKDDFEFTNGIMWAPWFYDGKEDSYINYATVGVRTAIALFKFVMSKSTRLLQSQVNQQWKEGVSCMLHQTKLLQSNWSESALRSAYEVARGTSVALDLASPLPDINAKRLFFARLCQQYCDRGDISNADITDFNPMKPSLFCEFAVRQQPLFWEAFGCWNFKGNCSIT